MTTNNSYGAWTHGVGSSPCRHPIATRHAWYWHATDNAVGWDETSRETPRVGERGPHSMLTRRQRAARLEPAPVAVPRPLSAAHAPAPILRRVESSESESCDTCMCMYEAGARAAPECRFRGRSRQFCDLRPFRVPPRARVERGPVLATGFPN